MKKLRMVGIVLSIFILAGCTKEVENEGITINLNDTDIVGYYSGTMINGEPDGEGTFIVYDDASNEMIWQYFGSFKEGDLKGKAMLESFPVIIENNGYKYTGIYTGEATDAVPDGNGEFICDAENEEWQYKGKFINGIISGNGQFEHLPYSVELMDNRYNGSYSGEAVDGKAEGSGIFDYNDGENIAVEYNGNWKDGKIEGKGELSSSNYCVKFSFVDRIGVFKGETENGIPNGEGTFEAITDENVSYIYSGGWKDGMWNGYGEQIYGENEFGLVNRKGNFNNNVYLPTPAELMMHLAGYEIKFGVTYEKKDYLDKNEDIILNWKEKGGDHLIDSELTYEKYMKKSSAYETGFMESTTIKVNQIWEEDTENTLSGAMTELVCLTDANQVYYVYYLGSLPDVYENTRIKMAGVPISIGSYPNVSGGTTNCIVFLAVDVEVK